MGGQRERESNDDHLVKVKSRHVKRERKELVKEFMKKNERESHRVRYIAQEDMSGYARKRGKWGTLGIRYFLSLEGCTLSMHKERNGPPRYEINVRNVKVTCRRVKNGLLVMNIGGKVLQFVLDNKDSLEKWENALEAAVKSDISEHYQFGKALGRGAFGEVVEGYTLDTREKRAIKIIQRRETSKEEHLLKEIEVLKTVNHDNIVRTYEIFNLKKAIYIVMENVSGGDLFDFISRHNTLSESQASQVMESLFRATKYLHERRIVHRDLKPENILCVNDRWPLEIKVTDFGFSRFADDRNLMTTSVGTAYFMAPEIITRSGYSTPVDLYACGVILYTILTGRLPFPGRNLTEYFRNVVAGQPKFPEMLWKGVSQAAQSLVRGLLQVDPEKRLTSFAALKHIWIERAAPDNIIKRDRSNLHHTDRKLLKPRASFVVISMVQKVKRIHELRYGLAKIPDAIDAVERGAKKTVVAVEKGAKKTVVVVEKGAKRTVVVVEKGAKKTGRGAKKMGKGIEKGIRRSPGHRRSRAERERRRRRRRRRRRSRKRRSKEEEEAQNLGNGLKNPKPEESPEENLEENMEESSESETDHDDLDQSQSDSMLGDDSTQRSVTTERTQSTESFVTAATSFNFRRLRNPEYQEGARLHAFEGNGRVMGGTRLLTASAIATETIRFPEDGYELVNNDTREEEREEKEDNMHDTFSPPNLSAGEDVNFQMDRPPPGLLRLLEKARRKHADQEKEAATTVELDHVKMTTNALEIESSA